MSGGLLVEPGPATDAGAEPWVTERFTMFPCGDGEILGSSACGA